MKLFHNLVEAVVHSLMDIFDQNYYADKVIERTLKSNAKWGSRDRAFIAEVTYDIVRNYRYLYEKYGQSPSTIYDWWQITGLYLYAKHNELPAWKEFDIDKTQTAYYNNKNLVDNPAIKYSVPDWLYDRINIELVPKTARYLEALHQQAPLYIRVNTLKGNVNLLSNLLTQKGIVNRIVENNCIEIIKRINLFSDPLFQQGRFEIQDIASQRVATYCNPSADMLVIDACAGGGGKTLHLAALMKNKGKIIALDTEAHKLKELEKRAVRAGIQTIETRAIENNKTIKRLENRADLLLLDVPCSGTGVIKRNPDAKWKLSAEFIDRIINVQRDILLHYTEMVRPGGMIVYSTCSILKSENEDQIKWLIELMPDMFNLLSEDRYFPWEGGDGFYMAKLQKK